MKIMFKTLLRGHCLPMQFWGATWGVITVKNAVERFLVSFSTYRVSKLSKGVSKDCWGGCVRVPHIHVLSSQKPFAGGRPLGADASVSGTASEMKSSTAQVRSADVAMLSKRAWAG